MYNIINITTMEGERMAQDPLSSTRGRACARMGWAQEVCERERAMFSTLGMVDRIEVG
jgi:hypothetical protein